MSAAKLPIRDLLKFMARAAAAAGQAARVVTSVADTIQGAPRDAEAQRALRSLAEAHQDLELRAHQLEARLIQLAEDDAGDDDQVTALEGRAELLEQRLASLSGRVDTVSGIVRPILGRLDAFSARLEELAGAAAAAGSFRQLGDQVDPGTMYQLPGVPALDPNPPQRQREG